MQKTLNYVILFLFCLFSYSCSKDDILEQKSAQIIASDNSTLSIAEAKDWFDNTILSQRQTRESNQNNKKHNLYFDWKKSFKKVLKDDNESIVVPVFNVSNEYLYEESFEKISTSAYEKRKLPNVAKALFIQQDSKGKKSYQIITYVPDKDFYDSNITEAFTGYAIYSDIDGNFTNGYLVKDNQITNTLSLGKDNKKGRILCNGYWIEVTWTEPLEGEAGVILHRNYYYIDGNCNNEDQNAPIDYGGGSSGGGDADNDNPNDDPVTRTRNLAAKVPGSFKIVGKCVEFSNDLKAKMQAKGIHGELIKVQTNTNFIYSSLCNCSISENGIHYGIKINNTVFDNMNPNGIDYNTWKNAMDSATHNFSFTPTAF